MDYNKYVSVNLNWNGNKVIEKANNNIDKVLIQDCGLIEAKAKRDVNKDTTRLASSITREIKLSNGASFGSEMGSKAKEQDKIKQSEIKGEGIVGTNVEYAETVEEKVKAYLRPAYDYYEPKIKSDFEKAIKDAIK